MTHTMINAAESRSQKQLALDLVENHNPTFMETMRGVARMLANRNGSVTSDDLQEFYEIHKVKYDIPAPTHHNAWGAVFNTKEFIPAGYTQTKRVAGKGRVIRVWRLNK